MADAFFYEEPREIEVLKRLENHENVIHYYDYFLYVANFPNREQLMTGLVMEYCAVIYLHELFSELILQETQFFG